MFSLTNGLLVPADPEYDRAIVQEGGMTVGIDGAIHHTTTGAALLDVIEASSFASSLSMWEDAFLFTSSPSQQSIVHASTS